MKNFNSDIFLNDVNQQPCGDVCHSAADPNKMWQVWKSLLAETIYKHAPIRVKRVGSNLSDEISSCADTNLPGYLDPTDKTFSLQFPSVNKEQNC